MKMDAVQRHALQPIGKFRQIAGDKGRGHHHRIAGAKIKWLEGHAVARLRIFLQVIIHRGVDLLAQRLDGKELAHVH